MLPTASDLDDPDGFVHREQLDFSELDKMLGEAAGGPAAEDGRSQGRGRRGRETRTTDEGDDTRVSLYDDAVLVLKGYEDQAELRQAYLDHLAAHPDGMWKACEAGHITASALVIDPERDRVLLTLHRKLRMWLQMGGHCEPEDVSLADGGAAGGHGGVGRRGADPAAGRPGAAGPAPDPCAVPLASRRPVRGAGARRRRGGDQRRVAGPALVRLRRGGGGGRRVGRTTAGERPARLWLREQALEVRGAPRDAGARLRPVRSVRDGQLQTLPWFCPGRPAPMPYWPRSPGRSTAFCGRQQLAGLHQDVALADEAHLPALAGVARRRQTPDVVVCACICTRRDVDQATTASASTFTYFSGVTCSISGWPEVIRATLP